YSLRSQLANTDATRSDAMKRGRHFWIATALVAATLASAGCRSGQRTAAGDSTGAGLSARTRAAIATAYRGSFGAPPASSARPERGKNIWLAPLSASWGAPAELVAAARLMGWHVTVFDGKFTPDAEVDGLRQAVAEKPTASSSPTPTAQRSKPGCKTSGRPA